MKKVKFLALMFLAGATLFTSCKKDEETDVPTISVSLKTGYDLNAWKGDTIKWTVTMGSNEKLATLKVEPNVGNSGTNVMNQTLDGTSQTVEYAYVVPGAGINDGDHIAITFTVTDNNEGTNNTIQTLTMVAPVVNTPLSTYSAEIYLSNQSWATYNTYETNTENTSIGVKQTGSNVGIITIVTTTGCDGWVVINDVATITNYEALQAAYTGTPVTTLDLSVNELGKAYVEKYFVSKVGTAYYLVHYKNGQRSTTTGNVSVFEYKTAG